jgi:hypothetical protein
MSEKVIYPSEKQLAEEKLIELYPNRWVPLLDIPQVVEKYATLEWKSQFTANKREVYRIKLYALEKEEVGIVHALSCALPNKVRTSYEVRLVEVRLQLLTIKPIDIITTEMAGSRYSLEEVATKKERFLHARHVIDYFYDHFDELKPEIQLATSFDHSNDFYNSQVLILGVHKLFTSQVITPMCNQLLQADLPLLKTDLASEIPYTYMDILANGLLVPFSLFIRMMVKINNTYKELYKRELLVEELRELFKIGSDPYKAQLNLARYFTTNGGENQVAINSSEFRIVNNMLQYCVPIKTVIDQLLATQNHNSLIGCPGVLNKQGYDKYYQFSLDWMVSLFEYFQRTKVIESFSTMHDSVSGVLHRLISRNKQLDLANTDHIDLLLFLINNLDSEYISPILLHNNIFRNVRLEVKRKHKTLDVDSLKEWLLELKETKNDA